MAVGWQILVNYILHHSFILQNSCYVILDDDVLMYEYLLMCCLFQMSEVVEDSCVYHAMGDMLYHIENEGQLPEF